jgi:predicted Zn-ribbon and HTH transcriptional regulator
VSNNAGVYLQRLVEDDYVHEQITDAVSRLHKAYRRAERKKAAQAAEDKKLYAHVRAAAGSLRRAGLALQRKPPKPKRRGRKLLVLAAVAGSAVVVGRKLSSLGEPA